MNDAILVAIIVGVVTVLGVILSNAKSDAVQNNELRTLREEIALHNNFARKLPMVEAQLAEMGKRIDALEKEARNWKN